MSAPPITDLSQLEAAYARAEQLLQERAEAERTTRASACPGACPRLADLFGSNVPLWTSLLTVGLVVRLGWWRRSRRWLTAALGCMLAHARLRAAFAEPRLSRRGSRLPFVVALVPTAVGEGAWLCCPIGVSAEDIADEIRPAPRGLLHPDVRVTRNSLFSALIMVEVIRRAPFAASKPAI